MSKPTPKALVEATGISQSYASMILSDDRDDPARSRTPARSLAIFIMRKLDWRHPILDGLTDEQIALLEQVEPWTPRTQDVAA